MKKQLLNKLIIEIYHVPMLPANAPDKIFPIRYFTGFFFPS